MKARTSYEGQAQRAYGKFNDSPASIYDPPSLTQPAHASAPR